jgi:hypothetical protein
MSERIMLSGSRDLTGEVFNGLRVQGEACRRPLRWNTECTECGSHTVWDHTKLLSGVARCTLTACYLWHTAKPPVPVTPRPEPIREMPPPQPAPILKPADQPTTPSNPSAPYRLYYLHCLKYKWVEIMPSAQFEGLSRRGHEFIAAAMQRDIERAIKERQEKQDQQEENEYK